LRQRSRGRLINIITKKSNKCSLFSADVFTGLSNIDLGVKLNVGKKAGTVYYLDTIKIDNDGDNFTDFLSDPNFLFKMDFRPKKKIDCLPLRRGVYEDRLRRCALGEKTYVETKSTAKAFIPNRQNVGSYQLPFRKN
jgi:outer membrane receptor for ferrienterochelin and colicins